GIKERLMAGGVDANDIVILVGSRDPRKYIEILGSHNLAVEGIAKYRGLESPVVIVLGAEALDTAELFSAYSRATTKFIAIYNATNPEWKGHLSFQARLQGNSDSGAILTKAQEPLRIRSLVHASTNIRSLGTKSLDLMWAEDWQALLVELETHESQMRLWVNYLSRVISQPVFVWFKDTLNKLYVVATVTDGEFESYYNLPLVMGKCKACDSITPCTSPP
ncbi:nuclease, partial [Pseudomonas shirazensis]